jgi:hypothetical protein
LVDQEAHFIRQAPRSRGTRLTFRTNQPDHSPDPKPDLLGNTPNAEPLGPQGQRCLYLLGVALLDRTPTKLLSLRPSTGQPSHHVLSDHCSLELCEHAEHLEHGSAGGSGCVEPLLMQEEINVLGVEVRQEAQQVRKGPTEPINGPSGHHDERFIVVEMKYQK